MPNHLADLVTCIITGLVQDAVDECSGDRSPPDGTLRLLRQRQPPDQVWANELVGD